MSEVEITIEAISLRNPRALVGMLANLAVAAVNLGADSGARRACDVIARLDGEIVGRKRAWTLESIESVATAMREDARVLPLDEFRRRWL